MTSLSIVNDLDPVKDIVLGFRGAAIALVVNALALERAEEALHASVVPTVALAAHRAADPMGLQQALIVAGSVLHTPIGVVHQAAAGLAPPDRHSQGAGG